MYVINMCSVNCCDSLFLMLLFIYCEEQKSFYFSAQPIIDQQAIWDFMHNKGRHWLYHKT